MQGLKQTSFWLFAGKGKRGLFLDGRMGVSGVTQCGQWQSVQTKRARDSLTETPTFGIVNRGEDLKCGVICGMLCFAQIKAKDNGTVIPKKAQINRSHLASNQIKSKSNQMHFKTML